MYRLQGIYGHKAFAWWRDHPHDTDLSPHQEDAGVTARPDWTVARYSDLVDAVAFLSVMNKRVNLAFRGQAHHRPLLTGLFRGSWPPPSWARLDRVDIVDQSFYRQRLSDLGGVVFEICRQIGLPRWRALKDLEEAQWAVIQHYGLWPTPMIDVSRSLRVAASFALRAREAFNDDHEESTGHLYVVGLPYRTGSITYSLDDQMLVAELAAISPPSARRRHLQEGLLVARFPTTGKDATNPAKNDLGRRTVAQIRLVDRDWGSFWSGDYPRMSNDSLLPRSDDDPLLRAFAERIEYFKTESGHVDWRLRARK